MDQSGCHGLPPLSKHSMFERQMIFVDFRILSHVNKFTYFAGVGEMGGAGVVGS